LEASICRRKTARKTQRAKETRVKARFEDVLVRIGDTFGTMVVRLWRPEHSRGSVFCIHGFEGNGGDFDYLAGHLVQRDLTVVCPDIIGRGRSSFFRDASKYNVDAYITCLAALSKYAGKKNYFLGTSWGGSIAMAFLAGPGVKADKLILNDVGLRGSDAADKLAASIRQEVSLEFDRIEDAHAYVRHTRAFLGKFSEDLWPDFLRNRIRLENGKYRLAYDPMAISPVRQHRYDHIPFLEKIKGEVLLLYVEHSQIFDAEAVAQAVASRPGISHVLIPGAAHPPSLMTREQTLLVSNFVAG
jgi:pimeloyl-ACP methyl ester carboxylesterase